MAAPSVRAFWWLTAGVCAVLLLPTLAQDGMFMDGLLYTTVAHNLANGFGSFWEPRFSQMEFAGQQAFHEHPPLVFGIQALWFRIWGSGFWVERLYCVLCAVVIALLLVKLWCALVPKDQAGSRMAWLAVLFWIIVPQVYWCLQNNMQENTMSVFTILAVLFVVRGANTHLLANHALAGLTVIGATMAKGPTGFFPLIAPVLWALTVDRSRLGRAVLGSVICTATVALGYLLMLQLPGAKASLFTYVNERLLHRIDVQPTVDHRWRMIQHVVIAMLLPLALALILRVWTTRRAWAGPNPLGRKAMAMVLIGLSGVLPMMLTMVQKSFYMVPALPFLSLACALWIAPDLEARLERLHGGGVALRIIQGLGMACVAAALILAAVLYGKPLRDEDMLHDVALIGRAVPAGTLINADPSLWTEWNLQSYLMRYHGLSLRKGGADQGWYLTQGALAAPEAAGYRPVALDTRVYQLWSRPGVVGGQ